MLSVVSSDHSSTDISFLATSRAYDHDMHEKLLIVEYAQEVACTPTKSRPTGSAPWCLPEALGITAPQPVAVTRNKCALMKHAIKKSSIDALCSD